MDAQTIESYGLAAAILLAMDDARRGNPFPLIELQWGKILRAADLLADPDLPQKQAGPYIIIDDFQIETLESIFDPSIREVYVKGNTGCGKGGVTGMAVCLFYQIYPDAQVVLTRDSFKTARDQLFGEIVQWWRRMRFSPAWADVQTAGIFDVNNRERHFVRVASPNTGEGFSGMHGLNVLFVFDEATAPVLNERFDLADTQCSKFLALANPRTSSGKFREGFQIAEDQDANQVVTARMGRRKLITIGGQDCLNVRAKRLKKPLSPPGGITIGERRYAAGEVIEPADFERVKSIIPGQTCYDEYLGLCANPDPGWVRCFANGRFMDEDPERQVMFSKWLKPGQDAWRKWNTAWKRSDGRHNQAALRKRMLRWLPVTAFGLDVGGSTDGDSSVLTAGGQKGIARQHLFKFADATKLVDEVIRKIREEYDIDVTRGGHPMCVDCDGLGWGVAGILRQKGCRVIEFRGNAASDVDPKKYANKRAEAYGELADRLNPAGKWKDVPLLLPEDDMLRQELVAPKKLFKGIDAVQWAITPKRPAPGGDKKIETVYAIIGRSPDRGDSAVYWFRALQHVGRSIEQWLDSGFF